MKESSPEIERLADCITLLKRGPHTCSEIAAVLGVRRDTPRRWCSVFEDKGHARASAKLVNGQAAKAWEWVQ